MRKYASPLTVLVMNRGDRLFRRDLFRHLETLNLGEIVWIGSRTMSADVEEVSRDFPRIRFILIREELGGGELVNIGVRESRAPALLAMWSDMRILSMPKAQSPHDAEEVLCLLPLLKNRAQEALPSIQSPAWKKGRLVVKFHTPSRDGEPALFPFDYCGIYQKQKFLQTGGFDPAISNAYWQKMDFGFRCHLWGEKMAVTTALTLEYSRQGPSEDSTPDESYKLFYLKNLAVRVRSEAGEIPWWRVFTYMARSGGWPAAAVKEFSQARGWVKVNGSRFKRSHKDVIDSWGAR